MLIYCLKCRKNTKNKDAKRVKTKNDRLALLSNVLSVAVKNQDL